ncbi:phage baseplate assembly protein V [Algicola sagamiensis]|uniref:phage baseplate assembly protein V n=1 Tax=Algicola sagamiensis TaxID=163869 RepID=UPI0003738D16|nr:phage baseplate assembly protein V [Algicola sagamiensis]
MDILFRLSELERQLSNLILIGSISNVDEQNALVQVVSGELETGWLPWLTRRAGNDIEYWSPEVGEQVVLLCPDGDPELGVVLPALYQNQFPALDKCTSVHRVQYQNGAVIEYDREANQLKATLPSGGKIQLVSDGGIEITGDTKINGRLHVTDNIKGEQDIIDKTRSMDADRKIYNKHKHPGVQSGPGQTQPSMEKM